MSAHSNFSFALQKGITGGFAPPTPDILVFVNAAPEKPDRITVQVSYRPNGTSALGDALHFIVPRDQNIISDLIQRIHDILLQIPMEKPTGSEDIYGMDTSLAWSSQDLEWRNGGPQGCGGGSSSVQATEEEKQMFADAVGVARQLIERSIERHAAVDDGKRHDSQLVNEMLSCIASL